MKKLLLILPQNMRSNFGGVSRSGKAGFIRLALPAIAALTPPGWDIQIIDARVTPIDYSAAADLVGITSFTSEVPSAYKIADGFRERGVKVVMGGVHASALPEEALEHADTVVVGEAEHVWSQLLDDLSSGTMKRIYKAEGHPDLKGLPLPRKDLLDRKMFNEGYNILQATRGCPFDCDYCSVTTFFGKTFRTRPVAEVIDEIRGFDTKKFYFLDDNIAGKPVYAKELFRALIPLKRIWGGQTSIMLTKDDELLDLYYRSGGRHALIGFESISKKNLENINKSWNSLTNYKDAIKKVQDAGISLVGTFIFGLDDDDPSIFQRTFEFILDSGIDSPVYHILVPYPGTKIYKKFNDEGRIIKRDWSRYHTAEVVIQPKSMTVEELQRGYAWIYKESYKWGLMAKRMFRSPWGLSTRIPAILYYRSKGLKAKSS